MKRDKKVDWKYDLKIYLDLLKKHKWLAISVLVTAIITQTLFVLDKLLYKYIIDKGTEFTTGIISREYFVKVLLLIVAIYISIILTTSFLKWLNISFLNKLDAGLIIDLKKKFFNHLIDLSYSFHTSRKTGQMISRLIRGSGTVEGMTDNILWNFVPLIVQATVILVSLIYLEWKSSLVIIGFMIVFISYSMIFNYYSHLARVRVNKAQDIERANTADFLTNIDSIKYFGKEKYIKNKFFNFAKITKKFQIKNWNYFRWLESGQIFIIGVTTVLLLYFPIVGVLNSTTTLGTLVFIFTVYGQIIGQLFGFVHGIRGLYKHMADFESLFQYTKIEKEIKDSVHAKSIEIKKGEIEFRDIDFKYPHRKILFDNFNLKIHKNEKVAFVGRSGSGKTTLVKLLYRFYDVQYGEILIDGKNIKSLKQESLRSELSIVPQECVLFDATIYDNVAFSKPSATKEEVLSAMKFAQLDKLVENLPKKERTIVGERGVKLSGGEKQRVSIARAILANKRILVLDEATSAMDSETESLIQEALSKLMKGRTTIIIAHRLSTIMGADKIVVFEKGKIVQVGKHRDLIKKPGQYERLWNLQKGGYIK